MESSTVTPESNTTSPGVIIAVVGIVLLVVGAFAPWITLGDLSSGGFDHHDGPAMVVFAGLAAVFLFFLWRGGKLWARILLGICAVIALAAGIYDASDIKDKVPGGSIGWGLWMCIAGGIALAVGVFAARKR